MNMRRGMRDMTAMTICPRVKSVIPSMLSQVPSHTVVAQMLLPKIPVTRYISTMSKEPSETGLQGGKYKVPM